MRPPGGIEKTTGPAKETGPSADGHIVDLYRANRYIFIKTEIHSGAEAHREFVVCGGK